MPRNEHKKRSSGKSDDHPDTSHGCNDCRNNKNHGRCSACVICPPCDRRESFSDSSSDHSCPDFSDICKDLPRKCEKLEKCKKEESEKEESEKKESEGEDDEYSDSDSESESEEKSERCGKRGCRGGCGDRGCIFIRGCSDASKSSVVSELGGSSDDRSCPSDFHRLACDQKRKCLDLVSPCKKKEEAESNLGKDEESVEKKKSDKSATGSGKGKKFVVSWAAKAGHPWEEYSAADAASIHINGKNGPVLHLYRGSTYFFCVEQEVAEGVAPAHRLVLTNSPVGGAGSRLIPGSFEPVAKGCVGFKVDDNTPRYFFYQDANSAFAGGLVIVHDKE